MRNKKKIESVLALGAIVTIIVAWFAGAQLENADLVSTLKMKMPEIAFLEEIENASYKTYNSANEFLYYVSIESAMGYGGPLKMAVAVDKNGSIVDLVVINSKETPSYLNKLIEARFLEQIIGKSYKDEYALEEGIDAVASATFSSRAVVEASKKGNRYVAARVLGFDVPKEEKPSVKFGTLEAVLVLLFAAGYFAHKKTFKHTRLVRWGALLLGLFVMGFYYNRLFTLSMLNQLLLGYFPPLHSHLYWYMLLGGIFLVLTIENKNPYCQWFCPFGAAQECLGLIGGAKNRSTGKFNSVFKWTLRAMVFSAIIAALLLRNPGVTSYEVFGTLFKLTGSNFQFALLGIVVVSSMFIKRPWCNYLCPVGPVTAHYSHVRKLILHQWKKKKTAA